MIRILPAIPRIPRFLLFLGRHMLFGMSVGVVLASSMILTNAAGLNDLIAGDSSPYLVIALTEVLFALTFGSVAMGAAIMLLGPGSKHGKDDTSGTEP